MARTPKHGDMLRHRPGVSVPRELPNPAWYVVRSRQSLEEVIRDRQGIEQTVTPGTLTGFYVFGETEEPITLTVPPSELV